jgi:hypothetical protein
VQRVLVTVRHDNEVDGTDLSLPDELSAAELTDRVAVALDWPAETRLLRIRLEPGGRLLEPRETLAQAGVRDGAVLVFAAPQTASDPPLTAQPYALPRFLPARTAPAERNLLRPIVASLLGLGVVVVLLGVWLTRPQTPVPPQAAVATAEPAAAPRVATPVVVVPATAAPSVPTQPLVITLPTSPPPTSVPIAVPSATPAPNRVVDAAGAWPEVLAQVDTAWGRNWPRVISLNRDFLQRFPGHAAATDKLYTALVEYGRELRDNRDLPAAGTAFQSAADLRTGRPEATAELEALAPPPPVALQPTVIVQPAAPVPARPTPPPAPEPQAPPPEPAPPPTKVPITRDGYVTPEVNR